MTRLSKVLSTIAVCMLLSIVAQQMVATSGYAVGGSVDEAAIRASIGRIYSEEEMRIEQEKAYKAHAKVQAKYQALSSIEKHQYLKAASWQYTWIPWIIMGLFIRLRSVSEWVFILVPLGFLAAFKIVWLRELFLIVLAVSVVSYAKVYLINRYNQLHQRTP
jgi:hypothetical protein